MTKELNEYNERVLEDDYPVNWDYLYIADGKIIVSDIQGTIKDLKSDIGASEITNYDFKRLAEK